MKEEPLLLLSDLQKLINQVVLIDYTIIILGGVFMATSSITKNFIISGQKQVEMFADAIEASANDRTPRVPINVTYLQGADDIIKFMEKRKKTDAASK